MPYLSLIITLIPSIVRSKWNSINQIKNITNIPILFLASTNDEIVPHVQMKVLYKESVKNNNKNVFWYEFNAGHNDVVMSPGYFDNILNTCKSLKLVE